MRLWPGSHMPQHGRLQAQPGLRVQRKHGTHASRKLVLIIPASQPQTRRDGESVSMTPKF
jgi:hypothetical protein